MHFTVVFNSHITFELSYGLIFVPGPLWKRGEAELLRLHPDVPGYERGDMNQILDSEDLMCGIALDPRAAAVVVHSTGSGTDADLAGLVADLEEAGFSVQTVRFGGAQA